MKMKLKILYSKCNFWLVLITINNRYNLNWFYVILYTCCVQYSMMPDRNSKIGSVKEKQ